MLSDDVKMVNIYIQSIINFIVFQLSSGFFFFFFFYKTYDNLYMHVLSNVKSSPGVFQKHL